MSDSSPRNACLRASSHDSPASRGHHASDTGTWSRVQGKEQRQSSVSQLLVDGFPLRSRLDDGVRVLLMDFQDAIHSRQVYADPAVWTGDVAFERGSPRVRHDGDSMGVGELHNERDVFGRLGVYYDVGQCRG